MPGRKFSLFEIFLLIVGVTASLLGFHLINQLYIKEGGLSWLMVIAIFNWLILIVLLISLSLAVDVAKKQLKEMKNISSLLEQKKNKKGL